jgi:protein gp37
VADTTSISWTDHTWNPWRGCTKISPGCAHCYMFTAQYRLAQNSRNAALWNPAVVQQTRSTWEDPLRWQRTLRATQTQKVFTCSWSDFFHDAADTWRPRAWDIIRRCPGLDFQILTKRPENIRDRLPSDWGRRGWPNVWLGTSIENPRFLWRLDFLRLVPAVVHFISAEPLLASLLPGLSLRAIEWLIVGGESGPGYRPMELDWARSLRDLAARERVPFWFKQSAAPRTEMGVTLDGKLHREFPETRSQKV